ncbi:MAG: DJ-1/PfpI family protein, partial [Pirellulaceae bacterium]
MSDSSGVEGLKFLAFVGEIYEDLELWYPKLRLEEAGAQMVVAGPQAGVRYAGKHGYPCVSDTAIASVDPMDFDGVLLPGGFMPD